MKNLILSFLIGLPLTVYGQVENEKARQINNELNESYVSVPATKVSLIPPEGFTPAINFNGFEQAKSNSSIMVVEVLGPFDETSNGFTEEGLKSRGVIMSSKEDLIINGYEGVFITSEQFAYDSTFSKYILAFGNDTSTIILNGMYPKDFQELGDEIKTSILSVVYEPGKETDPLESMNFKINVGNTKFQFATMISNSLLFTVDGLAPTQSDDKTILVVGSSPGEVLVEDEKQYAINRMKQFPTIVKVESENINSVTIDDISGYEIVSYGQDDKTGEPEMVYQIMLFSDNLYYLIVGIAKDNFEENLEVFKTVSKTFKRK